MHIKQKTVLTIYGSKSSLLCVARPLRAGVLVSYRAAARAAGEPSAGIFCPLPRPPGPQARVTPCSVADRGPGCWAMAFVAGCFQMSWVKMKILLQEPCDTRLSQDFCFYGAGLRTQTGVRPRRLLPPGSVFPLLLWAPRCLPQNSLCLEKSQELPVLFS